MPASKQQFSLLDKLGCAVRTQGEVAAIMTARGYPMKRAAVWHIERRALKKLRESLSDWYHAELSNPE